MIRKIGVVAVMVLAGCILLAAVNSSAEKQMPSFKLENVKDGKMLDSRELADKAMLITFFATWCPPCRMEVSELVKLQNNYAEKGFTVVGMSMDNGDGRKVKKFIDEFSVNYPVVMPDRGIINEYGGIYSIPTTFLVNRKGNVVKMYKGAVSYGSLAKDLEGVL
ncbi:MAG: cytochrome c biogenesis protein (TlpA) [Deltaproteobacteria bacterium]|nr:MAG: cytochrome c biogenesis protein (TlpA) [Deltaproteobacteria bacterium]